MKYVLQRRIVEHGGERWDCWDRKELAFLDVDLMKSHTTRFQIGFDTEEEVWDASDALVNMAGTDFYKRKDAKAALRVVGVDLILTRPPVEG